MKVLSIKMILNVTKLNSEYNSTTNISIFKYYEYL